MSLPASSLKLQARQLLQANRLDEARALYEQLCALPEADAEDWGDLGMIHGMQGAWQKAEDCCRQALALDAASSAAHCNLGVVLESQGRLAEAAASYRAALALTPDEPRIHANLGAVLRAQGKFAEAQACYQQALRLAPGDGAAHLGLGVVHEEAGDLAAAQACYEHARDLSPDDADAHFSLGNVLLAREKPQDAMSCYREAVRLQPKHAGAHNNLARAQVALGQLRDAADSYRRTIELNPRHIGAHGNLGNVLSELGRHDDAIACFQEALRLKPDNAEAYCNLGNVYSEMHRLTDAVGCFEKAIALNPRFAEALNNLGRALRAQGRASEGQEAFRRALRANPGYADALSNLLFSLNYDAGHTQEAVFAEYRRWGELHGHPSDVLPPPANAPDPALRPRSGQARRLRVGYVSPDLRLHSVAYFLEPILAHHDPTRVEVYAYSDVPPAKRDAVTERLQGHCHHWLDSRGLSDTDFARRVRADGIDILVDLAGHTAHHRLHAFARRPTPIQISYLGYPNTTGLPAMDYRLTDVWADPPGQEAFHTEELVRLPSGFLCYRPPDGAPPVADAPSARGGFITFGSFNIASKTTPEVVALWARLLHAVPESRLILKNRSTRDQDTRDRYFALFQKHGIERERIDQISWLVDHDAHLGLYSRIDIGLDTFPYNGTTTTCEALWMGVPVICLAGDRHAARVGVSLLTRLGLTDLIANTPDDYIEIARHLSQDPHKLSELRHSLRGRIKSSTLGDARAFTRELEDTYRGLWGRWCEAR